MSDWIKRDLRCTEKPDEHYEVGVLYRRSEGPPACPCGQPRTTFYATREMEMAANAVSHGGVDLWKPLTIGDQTFETRGDFEKFRADYAYANNVPIERVQLVSNSDRVERAERCFHRGWEGRKARGMDDRQWTEYRTEQQRKSAERSARR